MSQTIDQRIVEMRFDNQQFEHGVQTSLNTLDRLKNALNGGNKSSAAFDGLNKAFSSVSLTGLNGLQSAIDTINSRFSIMGELGYNALMRIENAAISVGQKLVSALTIEPIKTGFQEYETQMNAVQTILANTQSKGTTLDDVNKSLNELNHYADKTIYNFTQMTRNIGTFTAAGVGLEDATSAIQGIANLAAVSGSTSQQASVAMYQLSQALASGTVKLQDWNSVVNAGMGGQVFQDALKTTAKAIEGIDVDKLIEKYGSFRETLSKTGWLSTEVLTETLNNFTLANTEANKQMLVSKGYTEEEAKSILKMAETATDAATKVKTFSQLWDTTKEAAQSTWTQTWQYIIGDFEEAKFTLTEVSKAVGDFIETMNAGRNENLKYWHDFGGRTMMLQSFKNTFEALGAVLGTVGRAFREVFPETTSTQLMVMTRNVREFTKGLKPSEETLQKVHMVAKGFFSALSVGVSIVKAIAGGIFQLASALVKMSGGLLDAAAKLGRYISLCAQSLKTNDTFNKIVQKFVDFLSQIPGQLDGIFKRITGSSLSGALNKLVGVVGTALIKLTGFLNRFANADTSGFGKFADDVEKKTTPLRAAFAGLQSILSGIWEFFKSFLPAFSAIATKVGEVLNAAGTAIKNALAGASFKDAANIVNTGVVAMIALGIKKVFDKIADAIENAGSIVDKLTDILDGVCDSLKAFQTSLKADTLKEIAIAVGILAASIFVLSTIDGPSLATALGGMTVAFGELVGAAKLLSDNINLLGAAKLMMMGNALIKMAAAILVLSFAVKNLASLEWDQLIRGLVGIAGIAAVLVGAAKLMQNATAGISKASLGLMAMAVAIGLLVKPVKELGLLPVDQLAKGLVSVGVLCIELAAAMRLMGSDTIGVRGAVGVIAYAAAINILYKAVKAFGSMSFDEMIQGLVAVSVLLIETSTLLNVAGGAEHVMATGVAMIALGAAMVIFQKSVAGFGSMKLTELAKGLGAVAVVLLEMALATNAMTGALPGAAAILVVALAIDALTPALLALSKLTVGQIVASLFELAGVFAVFGGAAALLTPVIPAMFGLAGAIALLGAGMLAAGVGITAFAVGFTALVALFSGGIALISAAITGLISLIPKFVSGIVTLFDELLKGIAEKAPSIANSFVTIVGAILTTLATLIPQVVSLAIEIISEFLRAIKSTVPQIIDTALYIIDNFLKALSKSIPKFVQYGFDLIKGILQGIANNIPGIIKAAADIIVNFLNALAKELPRIVDAGFKLIVSFINGIADGIRSNTDDMIAAVKNLFDAMLEAAVKVLTEGIATFLGVGRDDVDGFIKGVGEKFGDVKTKAGELVKSAISGIEEKLKDVVETGKNFVQGFINGLEDVPLIGKLVSAAKDLGGKALNSLNESLDEHSPSKETEKSGANFDEGFKIGVEENSESVKKTVKKVGKEWLDELTKTIDGQIDIFGKYENKIGMTGKALLKNMNSWSGGLESWSKKIKYLAEEGIDKGLLQKLIDAGPKGVEYVNAFISMTSSELAEAGKAYAESMEQPAKLAKEVLGVYAENAEQVTESTKQAVEANVELGDSVTDTAQKLGETGEVYSQAIQKPAEAATEVLGTYAEVSSEAAGLLDEAITKNKDLVDSVAESTEATEHQLQKAQFAYENMRDSLKGVIDSQLDIFSEFKTDTELTSEQLITNMESQLNGVTTWSDELNGLISRGIDEGLLQHLAEMGPKGYEYVHAFTEMSDDELSHAGELYRNSLTISDEVSASIADKWATAGYNASLGFVQGIQAVDARADAANLADGALESVRATLDEHSPSRVMHDIGVYFVQGFVNGIRESYATATGEITSFAETCIGLLKIYFAPEKFQELGTSIGTGIQNGLNEAITAISTAFDAGGILESYGTLGQNIIQGIITGMSAKTAEAVTTVQTMMTNVSTAITGFNPQLNASGVGLITQLNAGMVSLQATVIATGNTIITQTKQKIDSFRQPYFNSGRDLIQKVIDGFKNRKSTVVNTADEITKEADQKINSYQNTYLQTGETLIEKLRTGVANKQQNVVTTADTLVKAALKAITDTYNDWYAAGQYIIQGLDAGISSMEHIIFEHLQRIAAEAIAAAEEECEIESPSKAFFRIGKFIDLGWVNGIDAYADKVTGAASGLAHNALYTVRDAFSNMASIVSDDISLDPTIRPVLDLTDVENGLTGIDSMLAAQRSLSMSIGGVNEEGLRQNRPYVIYLNTSTNLDGQVIATSMDTILGEAL